MKKQIKNFCELLKKEIAEGVQRNESKNPLNGIGTLQLEGNLIYTGEFQNGTMKGKSMLTYENEDTKELTEGNFDKNNTNGIKLVFDKTETGEKIFSKFEGKIRYDNSLIQYFDGILFKKDTKGKEIQIKFENGLPKQETLFESVLKPIKRFFIKDKRR